MKIKVNEITACLITRDATYPHQVLESVMQYPFGEIIVLTNCDSPFRKYELFEKAKFDMIYYQDDDAIIPINELLEKAEEGIINLGIKPGHFDLYKDRRLTMGMGWGSIFDRKILQTLRKYTDKYGFDDVFKREAERILTYLNYPQNRVILPVIDTPAANDQNRLWRQSHHHEYVRKVEERCKELI